MSSAYSRGRPLVGGSDAQQQYGRTRGKAAASDRVEPRIKASQSSRTRRLIHRSRGNHTLVTDLADGTGAINHGPTVQCSRDGAHDTRRPIRDQRTKTHAHRPLIDTEFSRNSSPFPSPPQQKKKKESCPFFVVLIRVHRVGLIPLTSRPCSDRTPTSAKTSSQSPSASSALDTAYRTPRSALKTPSAKGHSRYLTTTSRTHALVWVCAGAGVDGEAGAGDSRDRPTAQSCQGPRRRR